MSDPDNLDNDANTISWLPFHFLPGNDLAAADPVLSNDYVQKLVCRPDSAIARKMIASAARSREHDYALHRLGIAAHVFVDTFAHQGFAGLHHPINCARELRDGDGRTIEALPVPPIGHGQVGTCPDRPYLVWSYIDWQGKRVQRDNPGAFLLAAQRLCQEFRRYQGLEPAGLSVAQAAQLDAAFRGIRDEDGAARHARWLEMIEDDHFGFGAERLAYEGKAEGSWKHQALGQAYVHWLGACRAEVAAHVDTHGDSLFDKFRAFSGKQLQSLLDKSSARVLMLPPTSVSLMNL